MTHFSLPCNTKCNTKKEGAMPSFYLTAYGFGERGLSWYLQSGKINIFAGQLFFALQVDRANALESRAYRKFQTFKLDST